MKTKLLLGAFAILTVIGTASALDIDSPQSTDIAPNEDVEIGFEISNISENSTVEVTDYSTSNQTLTADPTFLDNNFTDGDNASFRVFADSNITEGIYNLEVDFEEIQHDENGTRQVIDNATGVTAFQYEREMQTVFEGEIQEQQSLQFENFNLTANQIENDTITFNHGNLQAGSQCIAGNETVNLDETNHFSFDSDRNFSYQEELDDGNTINETVGVCNELFLEPDTQYNFSSVEVTDGSAQLTIQSQREQNVDVVNNKPSISALRFANPEASIERGNELTLQTYNVEDGRFTPNVWFEIYDANNSNFSDSDSIIESGRTDESGYFTFEIPSDYQYDYLEWSTDTSRNGVAGQTGRINLTDYETFVQDGNITLGSVPENATANTVVDGVVNSNQQFVPEDTYVSISYPEDSLRAEVSESGNFDFVVPQSLETNDTLTVQAKRDNFDIFFSEKKEIRAIGDMDGDGIVDTKDRCQNEVGVEANDGCPRTPAQVELREWTANGAGDVVDKWSLQSQKEYQLRFLDENGDVIEDFNGEASLVDESEGGRVFKPDVQNGVMNISFRDNGGHTLTFDGNERFMAVEQNFYVGTESGGIPWTMLFLVLLLIGGSAAAYVFFTGEPKQWVKYIPENFREPDEEEELDKDRFDNEEKEE